MVLSPFNALEYREFGPECQPFFVISQFWTPITPNMEWAPGVGQVA